MRDNHLQIPEGAYIALYASYSVALKNYRLVEIATFRKQNLTKLWHKQNKYSTFFRSFMEKIIFYFPQEHI